MGGLKANRADQFSVQWADIPGSPCNPYLASRVESFALNNTTAEASIKKLYQKNILIVHPQQAHGVTLMRLLRHGGFQNITALLQMHDVPGYLAKTLNTCRQIDLILLTISQNENECHALCQHLQTNPAWRTLPVVVITEGEMDLDQFIRTSQLTGATDIISGPLAEARLLPRVAGALLIKVERDLHNDRERQLQHKLINHTATEARLQYLVAHDDLTGLYNRRRLEQLLELAVLGAQFHNRPSALFYLDLDQFKMINDTQGHSTGDRLLINVANHLKGQIAVICTQRCACLSDLTDMTCADHAADQTKALLDPYHLGLLARISADDFALLIENIGEQEALQIGEELRLAMETFHFVTPNQTYRLGVSIGVAMIMPHESFTASEILAQADQACYAAKAKGRNRVQLFRPSDNAVNTIQSDVHWVPLIHDALVNNRFRLVFQPVLNIAAGKVTHCEALIRMLDDNNQLVEPGKFIPVAERMGLIHEIDFWVVGRAIDWLSELPAHHAHLSVNVNLSTHVLQDPSLAAFVRDRLRATGVDACRITFEITETAAIASFVQTRKMVDELRALGCLFALDDFGAGFNSYSYLKHLPVDYLKIDGTFIVHLLHDPVDQVLVKSMIEIARTLGKKTVAEFVENAETLSLLKHYGVDYAQGYYLGKPALELDSARFHIDIAPMQGSCRLN